LHRCASSSPFADTAASKSLTTARWAQEPRLSGAFSYILGNARRPLELGRLTDGPVLTTEVEFENSAYRAKSEHSFGAIVQEHRSIVRIPTAA